ncbi:MAG: response regulator, partial [Myxococcota bacterium]
VALRSVEKGTAYVEMAVRDTGSGISPDHEEKIFAAFEQADGSVTRRFGGTGLGLTISRHLVELMEGEIGLRTKLGQGSTFWFLIPLLVRGPIALTRDLIAAEETERSAPARALEGLRVLLVEDNPINQEVALAMLESLGGVVACASNGEEALSAVFESPHRFDVVLMDCQMPVMDGFTATRTLRARERGTGRRVPIVALTANAMSGDREQCLATGMDEFVAKPFAVDELSAAVRRCLVPKRPAPDDVGPPDLSHDGSRRADGD